MKFLLTANDVQTVDCNIFRDLYISIWGLAAYFNAFIRKMDRRGQR